MNRSSFFKWIITIAILVIVIGLSIALGISSLVHPANLSVKSISDGSGGSILVWHENDMLYAQRIGTEGKTIWKPGGVAICTDSMEPRRFSVHSDGMGGAFITWDNWANLPDDRSIPGYFGPIPVYTQRLSSVGEPLWDKIGIASGITQRYGNDFPVLLTDGNGGAFVIWDDFASGEKGVENHQLRLQRVNPDGGYVWENNGILIQPPTLLRETAVTVANQVVEQYKGTYDMVEDGAGGVIVAWSTYVKPVGEQYIYKTYAQRVNGEGEFLWEAGNIPVFEAPRSQPLTHAIGDESGGVIIVIGASGNDYKAQRIGNKGNKLWQDGGVNLGEEITQIVSDGTGGVFLTQMNWHPSIPDSPNDLCIQKIGPDGQMLWSKQNVTSVTGEEMLKAAISSDGNGGAIIAWVPCDRGGKSKGALFLQKLDANGNKGWGEDGIRAFEENETRYQDSPAVISDNAGGAIIRAACGNTSSRMDSVRVQHFDAEGNALWNAGIDINN
ncbi:MAG: hypothetical protein R6U37_08740 [Dehalococcoidia bacterium]